MCIFTQHHCKNILLIVTFQRGRKFFLNPFEQTSANFEDICEEQGEAPPHSHCTDCDNIVCKMIVVQTMLSCVYSNMILRFMALDAWICWQYIIMMLFKFHT
jgi:hypothetical protein